MFSERVWSVGFGTKGSTGAGLLGAFMFPQCMSWSNVSGGSRYRTVFSGQLEKKQKLQDPHRFGCLLEVFGNSL